MITSRSTLPADFSPLIEEETMMTKDVPPMQQAEQDIVYSGVCIACRDVIGQPWFVREGTRSFPSLNSMAGAS